MIEDIKKTLWATADKLRANMDAAEYKHIVLGLIFVKYISDTFQTRRDELTRRFADADDDYFLHDVDADMLADELEDRDYYKEVNVFWVPEAARWETLRAQAKQADIGKRIDDALSLIELENPKLKGILDKRYARVQLPDGKLGELVDLVSSIGFGESRDTAKNHARDLLGQVYEYFLGQFASAEGKRGGQFYTPASIVKTLVAVLSLTPSTRWPPPSFASATQYLSNLSISYCCFASLNSRCSVSGAPDSQRSTCSNVVMRQSSQVLFLLLAGATGRRLGVAEAYRED